MENEKINLRMDNKGRFLLCANKFIAEGRDKGWLKYIKALDESRENGYAFQGDFFNNKYVYPHTLFLTCVKGGRSSDEYTLFTINENFEKIILFQTFYESGWVLKTFEIIKNFLIEHPFRDSNWKAPTAQDDLITELNELLKRAKEIESLLRNEHRAEIGQVNGVYTISKIDGVAVANEAEIIARLSK